MVRRRASKAWNVARRPQRRALLGVVPREVRRASRAWNVADKLGSSQTSLVRRAFLARRHVSRASPCFSRVAMLPARRDARRYGAQARDGGLSRAPAPTEEDETSALAGGRPQKSADALSPFPLLRSVFSYSLFLVLCFSFSVFRSLFSVLRSLFSLLRSPFTVLCSLFTVHCSLFTVHRSLFTVHCSLFTVLCSLFTVHCSLFTQKNSSGSDSGGVFC